MSARVLLVEDDQLAQDIISATLRAKGYEVDAVGDGFAAIQRLRASHYDLALVDYHMPDLDGLASARLMAGVREGPGPRIVALTGDRDGLANRQGALALFDAILPKPIQPHDLADKIEAILHDPEREQIKQEALAHWRSLGLPGRPGARLSSSPTIEQRLALELGFDLRAPDESADLVLLLNAHRVDDIDRMRWSVDGVLPVIDLTGELSAASDDVFYASDSATWESVAATVRRFADRSRLLGPAARRGADPEHRLLAYLQVADRGLEPVRDGSQPTFVRYNGFMPERAALAAAEKLADEGRLKRRFVDRFHVCETCDSHRLNVREECPSCRSPNLSEVAILHHFRCAWQGPETDARLGPVLQCPKCRQTMRYYGSEYDRAGTATVCAACGETGHEPAIGFSCMDCGAHADGESAPTRDVFAYDLTRLGLAQATTAPPSLSEALPAEVRDLVRRAITEAPHAAQTLVAEINYSARKDLPRRRFEDLRRLFIENLRIVAGEPARIIAGNDADYLVMEDSDAASLLAESEKALRRCEEILAQPIGASLNLIDMTQAA